MNNVDLIPSETVLEDEFLKMEDGIGIYQIKDENTAYYGFLSYERFMSLDLNGQSIRSLYDFIYARKGKVGDETDDNAILEDLYREFNIDKPESFKGRSLSMGDVVIIRRNSGEKIYYCDRFGFRNIKNWTQRSDQLIELIPPHPISVTKYELVFYEKDIDGNWYLGFACDENGNLFMDNVEHWADNYLKASTSDDYEKPIVRKMIREGLEPGLYECPCGNRFTALSDRLGLIRCPSCHKAFTALGGSEVEEGGEDEYI